MRLALFFSRGGSLQEWCETGLIDREKLIYEEHLKAGRLSTVLWLTYGASDAVIANTLKNEGRLDRRIEVAPMPRLFARLPFRDWIYSLFVPFVHRDAVLSCQVLKTNQMDGSWAAVIAKWLCAKPLIVRTGFTMSRFGLAKTKGVRQARYWLWHLVEKLAYHFADHAVVSSNQDRHYLIENYPAIREKCLVLRNYVDVDTFAPRPIPAGADLRTFVYVGRLTPQKNLTTLIDAARMTGITLDIYGSGELEVRLRAYAKNTGAKVHFKGQVGNSQIAGLLANYRYFVLASHFEGMPKTLLEAMACGLICVGTNVDGISEVLVNGVNGFLAQDTSLTGIARAIEESLNCRDFERISRNARDSIDKNYAITRIARADWDLLKSVVAR